MRLGFLSIKRLSRGKKIVFSTVGLLLIIGIVLSLWLTYIGPPSFQPTTIQADPGAIAPDRVFVVPQHVRVVDVAYGPGSDSLYVYLEVHAVNLWSALIYQWPEIVGMGLVLGVLWLALRLMRRGSVEDEPHCRGCHYLLLHAVSAKCPECGLELTPENRVGRRRSRWRLGIPLFVLALVVLGYVSIAGRRAWRSLDVSDAIYWPSLRAYQWGKFGSPRRWWWADLNDCFVYQVLEIDSDTGIVLRSLLRQTEELRPWQQFVKSHDAARLAILYGRHITVIDTTTNRPVIRLKAPNTDDMVNDQIFYQAEFSRDGHFLYTATWTDHVAKWDLRTGEAVVQVDLPDLFPGADEHVVICDIHELDEDEGVVFLGTIFDATTWQYDGFVLLTDRELQHTKQFNVFDTIQGQIIGTAMTTDHFWISEVNLKTIVIPRDGLSPIRNLLRDESWPWVLAISPDERLAALSWQPRGRTMVWTFELMATDDLETVAMFGNDTIAPLRSDFSPDGQHLAASIGFTADDWMSGIMIIDLESIEP